MASSTVSVSWVLISLLSLCLAYAQNTSSIGPVVDLGYVKYLGTHNSTYDIDAFFGIRFAAPPTGDLRFRAPVPIEQKNNYSSSSCVDASQWGPICFQGTPSWDISNTTPSPQPGDEDCLLLDVLVPSNPAHKSLPVWVQIHGGGYVDGYAERFPGWGLLQQSQGNLIYVSIQYRLDAFGFLSSTEVRSDGTANAGLLDQRLALNWIQRHISAFGGDPSRVTISGNSAGGGSVLNQLILYGGEDAGSGAPFSQAIAEYPWWQPYHNDTILEAQYREILSASNCSNLACLRSLSALDLDLASQAALVVGYNGTSTMWYGYGDYYYGPSVDGRIIRDLPSNELKQGHFTKVPLLVDRDGYEGVIFSNASETTLAEEVADLRTVFPSARTSFFTRLFQLYPADAFNSTFFQRQQIFGDFIINCPTYYMATALSDYGMPVWKMVFDAGTQVHGATVYYLFISDASKIDNVTLAMVMKDWFLSFVVEGDPNVRSWSNVSKPYWEGYMGATETGHGGRGAGFNVMSIDYTMMGVEEDPDASAQCDFFHGQSWAVRN